MEMTTAAGASENEAQMAAERLSKLKQTFNLTLDEIVVSNMEYVTGEVEEMAPKGCPLSSNRMSGRGLSLTCSTKNSTISSL